MGIIDSVSNGYAVVNRRFEILLIPVILDLYLWLGPRLSVAGLIRKAANGLVPPPELGAEYQEAIQEAQAVLVEAGDGFNLFSVIVPSFLGVPSLIAGGEADLMSLLGISRQVIEIQSVWVLAAIVLALLLFGTLLGAAFLAILATQVRHEERLTANLRLRIGKLWLRLISLGALLFALAVVLAVPGSLILGIAVLINPTLGSMLMGMAWIVVFWFAIYLIFLIQSLVINEVGLRKAIYISISVLRRNLWPALGLILVIQLVGMGMPIVWRYLTQYPWGTPLGILGNAYIGSGLAAALLIFYRDRFSQWMSQTEHDEEARA